MKIDTHIHTMTITLDEPKMNFVDIEYNALTLLVGANNVGKSFFLKTTWVMSFIATMVSAAKTLTHDQTIEMAQFAFDKSYENQTFTGNIGVKFNNGATLEVQLVIGMIKQFIVIGFDDAMKFPMPKYLSSKMRLFDNISMYLKIRKDKFGMVSTGPIDALVEGMLEYYPLYDIIYIEGLINNSPIMASHEINNSFKSFDFDKDIKSLTADLDTCDFYVTFEDDTIKYMKTHSAGQQAIVNMVFGSAS